MILETTEKERRALREWATSVSDAEMSIHEARLQKDADQMLRLLNDIDRLLAARAALTRAVAP